jgi:pimeloyl-ACP methyl ester carboxylesterase
VSKTDLEPGVFADGIPYVRFGSGPRTLLFLAGGPGNLVPSGAGAAGFTRGMKAFTDEYTICLVTRKSGLPEGYTTKDMSDDYAELISDEFGGHVELVMGVSYGGLIAQHFAADHGDLCDRVVICMAAHVVSDEAIWMDTEYADLIHDRKDRDAMALRADAAFNGVARVMMRGLLWAFGKPLLGKIDDTFRNDVVVEAKAERTHDSIEALKRIRVPVLVVTGEDDFAFPLPVVERMVALIPGARLMVYPGGHTAAFLDKRFAPDVFAFASTAAGHGAAPAV